MYTCTRSCSLVIYLYDTGWNIIGVAHPLFVWIAFSDLLWGGDDIHVASIPLCVYEAADFSY